MDYYNEDNSSKNQNLEENKFSSKSILSKNSKSKTIPTDFNTLDSQTKTYNNQKISELYKNKNFCLTRPTLTNIKDKNVLNCFEDIKTNNDYCSKCNLEIEYSTNACPHCLMPICSKCLKEIFNRNLDNNDDIDNFDQDTINEKMCPNCRSLVAIKDYVIIDKNKKNFQTFEPKLTETLDNYSFTDDKNDNNQASLLSRELEEQYNEYDLFLNKIEQKKKELENKKNLNINILQMIQKVIEYEFNQNINKLNEMIDKLKKIQKTINQKRNNFSQQQNTIDNNLEMQKNYDTYQNTIKIFSKNYEKFNQKIISKSKQKAYNFMEVKKL